MAASTSESIINSYEYMDETSIDAELKCTVCRQPFQRPVSLSCQHTFCRACIESWLNEHHSCPTCRRSPVPFDDNESYSPVNTHIVTNQLDRLLVRCNQCEEENIQRGNFPDHEEKCSRRFVRCSSANIGCMWKGTCDQLEMHLVQCPVQQIRPIIDRLQSQLDASLQVQNELQERLDDQSADLHFLLAFINKGNPMHKDCVKPSNRCHYSMRHHGQSQIVFHCSVCENTIRRQHVSLHGCSLNETIECICEDCFERQYLIPEESDEEYEYDDVDDQ